VRDLRIAFAGSPSFAAAILDALWATRFAPIVVLTQPDRPRGRGKKLAVSPVKASALEHACPVLQPQSLRDTSAREELAAVTPDILVVVAYGLLLPQVVLDIPSYGCLNVHASLLPRWRGAAPIERAIMAGDRRTGVCIMQMDAGLDTGPIHASAAIEIETSQTGGDLEARLAELGLQQLLKVLERFADAHAKGKPAPVPTPQNSDGSTYANKLTAQDRVVDWHNDAALIANQVRALAERMPVRVRIGDHTMQILSAAPAAQTTTYAPGTIVGANKEAIVVACGSGTLRITALKVEQGKGATLTPAAALNGYPDVFRMQNQFRSLD
jgi:methionyl-tRNA formyltransferase